MQLSSVARLKVTPEFCGFALWFEYVNDPFSCVTLDESFFWMLRPDNRAMGRVMDVVWYYLSVTKAKGPVTYPQQ